MEIINPLIWQRTYLNLIDQRELPHLENYVRVETLEDTYAAIQNMVVRGAPLIGFTALYGLVLHVRKQESLNVETFRRDCDKLIEARPTAVNLSYEVNRAFDFVASLISAHKTPDMIASELEVFASQQMQKLADDNLKMAKFAAEDLSQRYGDKKLNLMTLCNTGTLACGPMGTALGVIDFLHREGRVDHVYASETRPYLQGSRLSAYELGKMGVDYSITVEGAFSYLMRSGLVDAVFIGADRIVSNGDTANKIGSSTLAITCHYYDVPFYVVAPSSSFDLAIEEGRGIDIEFRDENEILSFRGARVAPKEARALNPSFDVTDNKLIEAIICEKGLTKKPYHKNISELLKS